MPLASRSNKPETEKAKRIILSPDQKRDVRNKRSKGASVAALSAEYGVSPGTISNICNYKR